MKGSEGLIHRRGFIELELKKWILAMPVSHHICESIEEYCGIISSFSEQHVKLRDSRKQAEDNDASTTSQELNTLSLYHQHIIMKMLIVLTL